VCAYRESKKRVDLEEGQLPEAPVPAWVEGAACVHQVCVPLDGYGVGWRSSVYTGESGK